MYNRRRWKWMQIWLLYESSVYIWIWYWKFSKMLINSQILFFMNLWFSRMKTGFLHFSKWEFTFSPVLKKTRKKEVNHISTYSSVISNNKNTFPIIKKYCKHANEWCQCYMRISYPYECLSFIGSENGPEVLSWGFDNLGTRMLKIIEIIKNTMILISNLRDLLEIVFFKIQITFGIYHFFFYKFSLFWEKTFPLKLNYHLEGKQKHFMFTFYYIYYYDTYISFIVPVLWMSKFYIFQPASISNVWALNANCNFIRGCITLLW